METDLLSRLTALSHPQRMGIFKLLMRRYPDALPAGEIGEVLGLKASTTSAYLSTLHDTGLITQSRNGTFLFYSINMDCAKRVVTDLFMDCCGGRPDLCPETPVLKNTRKFRTLFLCKGNSARSIFAEAILRHEAGDRFDAMSAGTQPKAGPNLAALETLRRAGLETQGLSSKPITAALDAGPFDFVFTVCNLAANESCPSWDTQPITAHWGIPDPVGAGHTPAEKRLVFQSCFDALRARILAFTALPFDSLNRAALQHHLDDIGRLEPVP